VLLRIQTEYLCHHATRFATVNDSFLQSQTSTEQYERLTEAYKFRYLLLILSEWSILIRNVIAIPL